MGHKILLADDSITIQKVIELTFSDEDFELHTVGNGQKAIDEIRSIVPDIVLCDIIMPEKNGYEVCEFIKSNDDLKHIPVLLLTGAFEPFDQERAKAAGCEGFLAKPFEPQTLISKVKELLAGAGAPADAQPVASAMPPMAPVPPLPDPGITQNATPDETVVVPPPAAAPPPPIAGPQVPVAPTPPPAPPLDLSPPLDQGFAVEAAERELAMEPGDHTMLLGANDPQETSPPPTPPGAGDDIWNQVSPDLPAEEEDSATVFMAGPSPPVQPQDMDLAGPLDAEVSVGGTDDPDATWQVPGSEPDPLDAAPPPAPPVDFGGFEDFAAPEAPTAPIESAMPPVPPPNVEATPAPPRSPALDEPVPEVSAAPDSALPGVSHEPIPSLDTEATIDPIAGGADAFPSLTPPLVAPEPPSAPEIPEMPEVPEMTTEPETPFEPVAPPSEPPAEPAPPVRAAPQIPLEPSPPEVAPEPEMAVLGNADEDLVERIAQRVVDKLSSRVIQEIAWEVVPDLAEGLIQKEIEALKSKMPKSG